MMKFEVPRAVDFLKTADQTRSQFEQLAKASRGISETSSALDSFARKSDTTATSLQNVAKMTSVQASPKFSTQLPSNIARTSRELRMTTGPDVSPLKRTVNMMKKSMSNAGAMKSMIDNFDTSAVTSSADLLKQVGGSSAFKYPIPEEVNNPALSVSPVMYADSSLVTESRIKVSPGEARKVLLRTGGILACKECGCHYLAENADHAGGTGRAGEEFVCRRCRGIDSSFR